MKNISLLLALLIFNSFLFAQDDIKKISLEDIWITYKFYPRSISGIKSMKNGENYTTINLKTKITKYNYKNGKEEGVVFGLKEIKNFENKPKTINDYEFNKDESMILFSSDVEPIYRHSFRADFYIWDIEKKELKKINEDDKIKLATFSPTGKKIAYVKQNNLFIYDIKTSNRKQITKDGEFNKIINGAPDWVYEEEFSFDKAFEWSPDGKNLAFIRFDESEVKEFTMPIYEGNYPELYEFKYPKAGEDNSVVSVHIYNLSSGKIIDADIGEETDIYIPRIKWSADPAKLAIQRMNRLQNNLDILLCDAKTGKSKIIYNEKNDCYIEVTDNLIFQDDKEHFLITNVTDGYNHIYKYNLKGEKVKQITDGDWEVTEFIGFDKNSGKIFYMSTETSPTRRALYSVNIDGSKKKRLTAETGVSNVEYSNGFKYFIDKHSDANTPAKISIINSKGKEVELLEDNAALKEKISEFNISKKEFFNFKTKEGVKLNGWMIKPYDFDENKKYPVFMTVYGGPGRQTVMDQWEYTALWHNYLAQQGYIVVSVDNRGTDGRGADFRRATYANMGKLETIDQIEAAKYFQSLDYVDGNRIGIQGWSYGGFMATSCLAKGNDIFKMAIAVAPVSNWRYYDSIYTERYMGLPQNNEDGYDENSPINHVRKIKGDYMLVHGSADDNVHFQNTMELINALVQANVHFDLMVYPNSNHGIYTGMNTRFHLFTKMSNFVKQKL